MKWVTKATLRAELAAANAELRYLRDAVTKLERLVDHEREVINSERARADRAADALLQQNGLPPVTDLVVGESKLAAQDAKDKFSEQQKILEQLYAESLDAVDSDEKLIEQYLAQDEGVAQ
jgi:bacterioferritin (cytochrome b1)